MGKQLRSLNSPYQNYVMEKFPWKSEKKNIWLIFNHFWLLSQKWRRRRINREYESNFWILHIKIRLCGNFHENSRKKFLTHFSRHFWLIKAKMKMQMKKFRKISSIFEFSISKLSYMELFIKTWEKRFVSNFFIEKDVLGQRCRKG